MYDIAQAPLLLMRVAAALFIAKLCAMCMRSIQLIINRTWRDV